MAPLTDQQKADAINIARDTYQTKELNRIVGVPIGTTISSSASSVRTGNSLFGYINSTLDNPKSTLKNKQDVCAFINEYVDTPYKNIITSLTGKLDVIPTEIVTQNIQAIQVELDSLQETMEDRKKDQQTAIVRDKILRSGNGAVTNHQIYLLGRPLRPASIPFLWALSTLFIGFALLIFYTYYPYTTPPLDVILFDLYMFFTDPFTWAILFSIASVVILFLSLRIAKIL
jgi:hypothetical protein